MMNTRDIGYELNFIKSFNYSQMKQRLTVWRQTYEDDEFAGMTSKPALTKELGQIWGHVQLQEHMQSRPPIFKQGIYCIITRYNPVLLSTSHLVLASGTLTLYVKSIIDLATQHKLFCITANHSM